MTNNLGENIKKLRELKSITRERLASDLNMSVSNYSKIERSEIDLTISRVYEIANILGVDISQLLNFDTSQVFNIHDNEVVQAPGAKAETMHFYKDEYKDKYIKMLEEEIKRLKRNDKNK
jgi:transcriptional regulator with XRE-family HTH domain